MFYRPSDYLATKLAPSVCFVENWEWPGQKRRQLYIAQQTSQEWSTASSVISSQATTLLTAAVSVIVTHPEQPLKFQKTGTNTLANMFPQEQTRGRKKSAVTTVDIWSLRSEGNLYRVHRKQGIIIGAKKNNIYIYNSVLHMDVWACLNT